jgi:L-asparaginase
MSKIVVLGTGGTIAGMAAHCADNVGYRAAQVEVSALLTAIPSLTSVLGGYTLVSEQVMQMDSKDLDLSHLGLLAQRVHFHLQCKEVTGVVITHGTDTIEETAYFLSQVLPPTLTQHKAVVLTCAMRPASSATSDGPQNILDAVAVAALPGANGVVVVCAGVIHSARHVQKVHTYRLDAFDSGDVGPLGYVNQGEVRLVQDWPEVGEIALSQVLHTSKMPAFPRVEIVMNYVGAMGATVRALCAGNSPEDAPVQGIVVAGTGNGSIHADLQAALLAAQLRGVKIVRATRCAWGEVIPATPDTDAFRHSKGLSPVKARIALILELLEQA